MIAFLFVSTPVAIAVVLFAAAWVLILGLCGASKRADGPVIEQPEWVPTSREPFPPLEEIEAGLWARSTVTGRWVRRGWEDMP